MEQTDLFDTHLYSIKKKHKNMTTYELFILTYLTGNFCLPFFLIAAINQITSQNSLGSSILRTLLESDLFVNV